MNARKRVETSGRLMDIEELRGYLAVGRNTAAEFGKQTGAIRKFGSRTLYDRKTIDAALDRMADE